MVIATTCIPCAVWCCTYTTQTMLHEFSLLSWIKQCRCSAPTYQPVVLVLIRTLNSMEYALLSCTRHAITKKGHTMYPKLATYLFNVHCRWDAERQAQWISSHPSQLIPSSHVFQCQHHSWKKQQKLGVIIISVYSEHVYLTIGCQETSVGHFISTTL